MKVRQAGRIVSVAVIIAVAVNTDGRREVVGMQVGASEAEPFWTDFLRSLTRRGLRGVKLVISDSHEGLKKAAAKVLSSTWQRCRASCAMRWPTSDPIAASRPVCLTEIEHCNVSSFFASLGYEQRTHSRQSPQNALFIPQ